MNVCKKHIEKRINEIEAIFASYPKGRIEQAHADWETWKHMMDDLPNLSKDDIERFKTLDTEPVRLEGELTEFKKTMGQQLMKVETRYVVTNEELINPAGFHPDDRVFIQTQIAIHTNDPKRVPRSNQTLYIYDLEKA